MCDSVVEEEPCDVDAAQELEHRIHTLEVDIQVRHYLHSLNKPSFL